MSGQTAQRGFIFQTIIAMIECLERDDWDEVKVEPNTKLDKVDIQLYQHGDILCAIQVKSSQNPFQRSDVKGWLEDIRKDVEDAGGTGGAQEILLYLVGDSYASVCRQYVDNNPEIKTAPFAQLEAVCTKALKDYIVKNDLGDTISVSDWDRIEDLLFAMLHKNSIKSVKISRSAFEKKFQGTIVSYDKPDQEANGIPRCLTPIPSINHEVGLVGRDEKVKEVRDAIERESLNALVSGLGGIGKTALMQWVCNAVKDEGHYVAWINCGESLKEDLLVLGKALGIKDEDADTTFSRIIHTIQTRLDGQLYLFLDDLSRKTSTDEINILNSLGAHIVITSRKKNPAFPNIKIDVLEEDIAVTMFFRYYNGDRERPHEEAVRHIVRTVNRHTLLVELLAKAALKKGGSLEEFDEALEAEGFFDVFKRKLTTEHDKNLTIEESVMKLYQISHLSEEQQSIMKLFSIFAPEKEIYYKVGEWAGLDLDALDELVELSWLDRGGLENGYHIHQIIKDSLRRQMQDRGETLNLDVYGDLIEKVTDTDDYLSGKVDYLKVRERLTLAEDVAAFLVEEMDLPLDSDWDTESISEDSIKRLRKATMLYNNIGGVYREQGEYEKALEYCGKALVIREKILGKDHPATATTYNNIGGVYNYQGEYEKALEYYGKAIAIHEKILGKDHPKSAIYYHNIAVTYYEQGEYEKALEYYGKALAIHEKVLGKDHPETAIIYNSIAGTYYKQGEYEKALEYHGKAIAIHEKVLGKDHPDTATMYNGIGLVYSTQGDYRKGLEYYVKALAIREKVLGKDHPNTAATYNNIGLVLHAQGEYEKALEYYEKAHNIFYIRLGKDHPHTQSTERLIMILREYFLIMEQSKMI